MSEYTGPERRQNVSISGEMTKLRGEVAQLCQAVRGLVTLQSVMDKKLDAALKGGVGADFAVL
jgi:hypothetical protein